MFGLYALCLLLPFNGVLTYSVEAFIQTNGGLRSVVSEHFEIEHLQKRSISTNFGPDSTYSSQNGLTCYVCRPGFYRKSDCTSNGTTAVCERCPDGQYSSMYNIALSCARCSSYCVDANAAIYSTCNSTSDLTCRCKDGFYNHSKGGGEWMCVNYKECPPGEEVDVPGNFYSDTTCKPCSPGTYSSRPSLQKCEPCRTCTPDQSVKTNCELTANTVCESKSDSSVLKIVIPIVVIVVVVGPSIVVIFLWRTNRLKQWLCSNDENSLTTSGAVTTENHIQQHTVLLQMSVIRDEEEETPNNNENPKKLWSNVFRKIAKEINIDEWKSVIRNLLSHHVEVTAAERKIKEICDHDFCKDGVVEHIYQCLLSWSQLCDQPFLDEIISALEADNMLSLADELQKIFPSLLKDHTFNVEMDRDQD